MAESTRPHLPGETPWVVLLGELNEMEARYCLDRHLDVVHRSVYRESWEGSGEDDMLRTEGTN